MRFQGVVDYCRLGLLQNAIDLLNYLGCSTTGSNKPLVYASLLQTSVKTQSLSCGLQLHARVLKSSLDADRFVGNSLLSLYFKLRSNAHDTRKIFDALCYKDVVSWSSMLSAYIKANTPKEAIYLFAQMLAVGADPSRFSFSAVIKAAADDENLAAGRSFHCQVVVRGFEWNCVICSSLINLYGRNSAAGDARKVFDEIPDPDSICWTGIVSAYARNEMYEKAMTLFLVSLRRNVCLLDEFTYGSVVTACGNLRLVQQGREVHCKAVVAGFNSSVIVNSGLVDMYGKMKLLGDALMVFDGMNVRNSVTWSALLDGYCQNGDYESVVRVFRESGTYDLYSFGSVLRACSGLGALRSGKEVHCHYVKRNNQNYVIIESALVDLYAKCGCVAIAVRVFDQMPERNLITWNAMINGFALNSRPYDALRSFNDLLKVEKPDHISFLGALLACSHSGLVEEGRRVFFSMRDTYEIRPRIEHYNCVVDLLGRAGLHGEAERLIINGEFRNELSLWVILLGACAGGENSSVGERIAKRVIDLNPDHYVSYIYLANLYRAIGRWEEATNIRKLMHKRASCKITAKSWIPTIK